MIQALLLAALGLALGLAVSFVEGPRTPQSNFNNVRCGILGALIGGLLLPRTLWGAAVGQYDVDIASLLTGTALAAILLALLTMWRRRALSRS